MLQLQKGFENSTLNCTPTILQPFISVINDHKSCNDNVSNIVAVKLLINSTAHSAMFGDNSCRKPCSTISYKLNHVPVHLKDRNEGIFTR